MLLISVAWCTVRVEWFNVSILRFLLKRKKEIESSGGRGCLLARKAQNCRNTERSLVLVKLYVVHAGIMRLYGRHVGGCTLKAAN